MSVKSCVVRGELVVGSGVASQLGHGHAEREAAVVHVGPRRHGQERRVPRRIAREVATLGVERVNPLPSPTLPESRAHVGQDGAHRLLLRGGEGEARWSAVHRPVRERLDEVREHEEHAVEVPRRRLPPRARRDREPEGAAQADLERSALGRPLVFEAIPEEEARRKDLEHGTAEPLAAAHVSIWRAIREGRLAAVTDGVLRVLGRAPHPFTRWVEENLAAFR